MNKGRGDWKGGLREEGLTEDLSVYGCDGISVRIFINVPRRSLESGNRNWP